jgi:cytochrome c2
MTAPGSALRLVPWVAAGAAALLACRGGRTDVAAQPLVGGDPRRGAQVVRAAGCGACHEIPDIGGARGEVGPSLRQFARRTYIGGQLTNTPAHLIEWIVNPHAAEPRTAMPVLGLDHAQARDVAAFLYTLE